MLETENIVLLGVVVIIMIILAWLILADGKKRQTDEEQAEIREKQHVAAVGAYNREQARSARLMIILDGIESEHTREARRIFYDPKANLHRKSLRDIYDSLTPKYDQLKEEAIQASEA